MRILYLTRYGRLGASSRMRAFQYFPKLKEAHITVDAVPLFSDRYIENIQANTRVISDVISGYAKRIYTIIRSNAYDFIWIQGELFPWIPALIELALIGRHMRLIIDYDDAIFHYYDQHNSGFINKILGKKHEKLIRRAELVVAGNEYLASYARAAGARRVEILPTVIDLERYPPPSFIGSGSRTPVVGWIGQRATSKYLHQLSLVLNRISNKKLAVFSAIGIEGGQFQFPCLTQQWKEDTEVESLCKFDIGIMPLDENPFSRGKCGYKLIQYMACGLPVVASPVGVNSTIVEHGVNGYLARTLGEWEAAISELANNPDLRFSMGQMGRAKVEREYCLQVTAPRFLGWLRELESAGTAS